MYRLTATYAHPADPEAFAEHYRNVHAPLAAKFPKVKSFTWGFCETPDGSKPAHYLVASVIWASKEDALEAMGSEEGQAAVADLETFAQAGVDIEFDLVQTTV